LPREQPPVDQPAAAGRRRGAPVSGTAAHDAAGGAGRGLGAGFARLWAAAAISNVGDGIYATALPLLAASLTRDPFAVSLVTFGEWLPWLLFGLVSGALLDRWERRRVMWTVDAARFAVVGALAAAVVLDRASIALLAAAGFLLGTGQTLVDTAQHSIVPALVSRDPARLERANGRLQGTQIVANQFVGPPAGGFLFSLAAWIPLAVDAVSFGRARRWWRPSRAASAGHPARRPRAPPVRRPGGRAYAPRSPRGCTGCCGTGCCAPSP
jgi:MFS family permease